MKIAISNSPDRPVKRPRIFVECTATHRADIGTGIQRVVRNVLRHLPAIAEPLGYDVVPIALVDDVYEAVDLFAKPAEPVEVADPHRIDPIVTDDPHHRNRRRFHKLRREVARIGRQLHGLARCARAAVARSRSADALLTPETEVPSGCFDGLHEQDILLVVDATWVIDPWKWFDFFHDKGGRICFVVYDLIPISHPNYFDEQTSRDFARWLTEIAHHGDAFACISQFTRTCLDDHFAATDAKLRAGARSGYFHLGSDLDGSSKTESSDGALQSPFNADRPSYIMVGSLEPRKGHAFVLDAFERHWAAGGCSCLLVIAHRAWKSDNLLERIKHHPRLGTELYFLRNVGDAELEYAYRNASGLIVASEVEGFGLPIVEAYQRGLPVLCSDIPVFREIGEGRATFFRREDPAGLVDILDRKAAALERGEFVDRTPQDWIDWAGSMGEFMALLKELIIPTGTEADSQGLPGGLDR